MTVAHYAALAIWTVSVLMVLALFVAAYYGGRLTEQNPHNESMLRAHRKWAWISFCVTAMAVAVIEPTFRIFHLPYTWFFFWLHAPLLGLYATFLILALIFDGVAQAKKSSPAYPRRHNTLGRRAQYFGLLTALTGDILVYQLLWLHHPSALH